jgi:sulfoxide reductase heme-binding subunit YedZ
MSRRTQRTAKFCDTQLAPHWLWWVVTLGALTPLAWLGWRFWQGTLGVDPVNTINNETGRAALIVLFLAWRARRSTSFSACAGPADLRKSLGLIAFVYAALHLTNFVGLDYAFDFDLILHDAVLTMPYILAGSLALLILTALAITSTRGWMKRLGRNWKRLHRLAYAAGDAGGAAFSVAGQSRGARGAADLRSGAGAAASCARAAGAPVVGDAAHASHPPEAAAQPRFQAGKTGQIDFCTKRGRRDDAPLTFLWHNRLSVAGILPLMIERRHLLVEVADLAAQVFDVALVGDIQPRQDRLDAVFQRA